ncbi:uncharacterized protein LOC134266746 [Saccostrea cucullata]|uniref:uncharacterized protein LOC134266746 n=1 Tax=Saccostrea cuccullata TaxID=36930 RepID=UPI002ED56349
MPLFWRSLLVMYWIKCFYGQKIDYLHQICSAPEDMEFLKNELSILRRIFQKQEKNMEILKKELNVFKKTVEEVSEIKETIQHLSSKQTTMGRRINQVEESVMKIKRSTQQIESSQATIKEKMNQEVAFTAELKYGTSIYALKENEKIVFSHVVTSRGNAYNNDTGIFRCPRSGLYAFFFNILTLRNKWALVEITNGNYPHAIAYAEGSSEGTNGSNFVLLSLSAGTEIWLRAANNWTSRGEIMKYNENTFSGFLVHPY